MKTRRLDTEPGSRREQLAASLVPRAARADDERDAIGIGAVAQERQESLAKDRRLARAEPARHEQGPGPMLDDVALPGIRIDGGHASRCYRRGATDRPGAP